jgi:outer membrane protein OmpA-like peptidoglycan-associated protein
MKTALSRVLWTVGLMGVSVAAMADQPKAAPPQEPLGFVAGGVIGGLAAGPVGAVIGAGIGTWLGSRVHRANEAARAEAQVAALQTDKSALQGENTALLTEKSELSDTNQALSAQLEELSQRVEAAQAAPDGAAEPASAGVLDGLQGNVLFRTGSAEVTIEMAQQIQVLAQAVAKSPELKVRLDGFADPRGTEELNLKLSEERANAVRDLFLAAGVTPDALEVKAYGKSQSVAQDADGYAMERRVRLTLQAAECGDSEVAQVGANN